MKARLILIAALLALSTGIFWKQRRVLTALEQERATLTPFPTGEPSAPSRTRSADRPSRRPPSHSTSPQEQQRHLAAVEELLQRIFRELSANPSLMEGDRREIEERQRLFNDLISKLDQASFASLLEKIMNSAEFPPDWQAQFIAPAIEFYSKQHPEAAFLAIVPLEHLPDRQHWITSCFRKWSLRQPTHALRWFQEKFVSGDPTAQSPAIVEEAFKAHVRIDPVAALNALLSEPFADQPELAHFGNVMAQQFRTPQEHLDFFRALTRKTGQAPDAEVLPKMRAKYLKGLAHDLHKWPAEDALPFLETELTPDEQLALAPSVVNQAGSLSKRSLWADWLLRLDPPDDHPAAIGRFVDHWTMINPATAREWLDSLPEGPRRTSLLERHEHMSKH